MTDVFDLATAPNGVENSVLAVFVQGWGVIYTNDRSGDVHGTGWIGAGDGRTVKGGLISAGPFRHGLDEDTLQLENQTIRLRILDHDGTLAADMGTEPDEADTKRLSETLVAGSSNLSTSGIKTGWGANKNADNPRGKHIGVERIGPNGERNHWWPFPFTHPGPEHFVDEEGGERPVVTVTDDPLVWEGRVVTVWRIFRDVHSTATGAAAWPSWSDHFDSGVSCVWMGRLRARNQIGAEGVWELSVSGERSLLNKTINANAPTDWLDVSPLVTLSTKTGEEENEIAVGFRSYKADEEFSAPDNYKGSIWHASNDLSDGTPETIAAAINTAIQNAAAGTNTNHNLAEVAFDTEHDHEVAFSLEGVTIKSKNFVGTDTRVATMTLGLSEAVWKICGYDPAVQSTLPRDNIRWLQVIPHGGLELDLEPARPGYIYVRFDTKPPGADSSSISQFDNDGATRIWRSLSAQGGTPIEAAAGQEIEVRLPDRNAVYLQGQNFRPPFDGTVDGNTADATRLFAFRGPISRMVNGEVKEETITQVARCSWADDNGAITESTTNTLYARMRVDQWYDPRTFGLENPSLDEMGIAVWHSPGLKCIPLGTFTYTGSNQHEYTSPSLMMLLTSTGTSTGWVSQTLPDYGDNDPSDRITSIGGDREIYDFGLAIPEQLVASEQSVQDAFDAAAGGWSGPLNRHRIAVIGPVEAKDILQSWMQRSGCGWTMHGGQFGVFNLYDIPAPDDVDVTITDADLGSSSIGSHIPVQHDQMVGRFKRVTMDYRHVPGKSGGAHQYERAAQDRAAVLRDDIEREVLGLGLPHIPLWDPSPPSYVPRWENDMAKQWARNVADFWAQRNVVLELALKQHIGCQVWQGSSFLLTTAWPHNPVTGSRGMTGVTGRFMSIERDEFGYVHGRALIYGATLQGLTASPHYAPAAITACGYNPATRQIHVDPDPWKVGDDTLHPVRGFVKPSWASALPAGNAKIQLWELHRDRTVTTGPTAFVESVDEAGDTITITPAGFTGTYRRSARYLVMLADLTDPAQASWCLSLYAPITDSNGDYDGGASKGSPWLIP